MTRPAEAPRAWVFDAPVPYAEALRLQEHLVEARIRDAIPDTVLCLEHPPVVTLGRRGRRDHLRCSADALRARGIDLVTASRGGDVTYHGPGQLVLYPILRLREQGGSRTYLHRLEQTAIDTAAAFGVKAWRRGPGLEGAWTEQGKLAAIGLRFRKWVSYHGMSFNLHIDPRCFDCIVPCGLEGEPVCSLHELVPAGLDRNEVRDVMLQALAGNLSWNALSISPKQDAESCMQPER